MLPETPMLVRCPNCKEFVWLLDAPVIGQGDSGTRGSTPAYLKLSLEDLEAALRSGVAKDADRLRYLRVRLWWASNDPVRGSMPSGTVGAPIRTSAVRENMQALFTELSEKSEAERLIKAELARELGQMPEAQRLLAASWSASARPLAAKIAELLDRGSALVAPLLSSK